MYKYFLKLLIIFISLNNIFLIYKHEYNKDQINKCENYSRMSTNNSYDKTINFNISNFHRKRFIITVTPIFNNYGDEAILISTTQFLHDYFPEFEQIIINASESSNIYLIKKFIYNDDIIIINGGGNFGLYDHIVREQVNIVKNFPNNNIIFFPCSIFFKENLRLKYTHYLDIINQHHSLTFFIREKSSFNISKKLFTNSKIYLVPDIATRLNFNFLTDLPNERKGILLILRKDREILLNNREREYIKILAKKYFNNDVIEHDSANFKIPEGSNIINETFNFIKLIKSKKLVITDRLHGMILSIISSTPVIAFSNNYHKVESSFNSWFYNISYAFFIKYEEISTNLEPIIKRIIKLKTVIIDKGIKNS